MTHTFELDESIVTLKAPDGAEFSELQGLPQGQRHHTWTAGPGAFFMVSAGAPDGFDGVPEPLDSDEPAPLAGPGARRVVYRSQRRRSRRLVAAPEGARSVPEEDVREVSDLLLVPGEHEQLRIGYRVPEDARADLRERLARMLDSVEVRRHA